MSDEEKRVATMINTASGRNALRGFDNEFGSLEIMAGRQRKRRSKEEVSSNTEKVRRENKQDENVETGQPISATAANDDKVFAISPMASNPSEERQGREGQSSVSEFESRRRRSHVRVLPGKSLPS